MPLLTDPAFIVDAAADTIEIVAMFLLGLAHVPALYYLNRAQRAPNSLCAPSGKFSGHGYN
jgi:hypothetical protein